MRLSLLICHLPGRAALLQRLMSLITVQQTPDVEILVDADPTDPTGTKRNRLLDRARGDYLAFIDDDDLVSPVYVPRIIEALERDPDVVGMELIMTRGGENPQRCIHSLRYRSWFEIGQFPHCVYFRNPNHLNPVRTQFAREARFPDVTQEEDRAYSARLLPMLQSEVYLDGPIYHYLAD